MATIRYFDGNKAVEITGTQTELFKKAEELHASGVSHTWLEFEDGRTMHSWTTDMGGVDFKFE